MTRSENRFAVPEAVLTILLIASSGAASADWIMASESDAATVYVDPATILRTGDRATLMELTDYKAVPDPARPYKSARRSYQFDCNEGAYRPLSMVMFAENMAAGEMVLIVNDPAQWLLFTPGAVSELLWKIACRMPANPG